MKNLTLKTVPISVNALYRGRRFLTKEGKGTKEAMGYEAKSQFRGKPLKCVIGLDIDFYVPNMRSDLDNLLKATLDCLTGIIWEDDRQVIEILARKYQEKKNPRIELTVNDLSTLQLSGS